MFPSLAHRPIGAPTIRGGCTPETDCYRTFRDNCLERFVPFGTAVLVMSTGDAVGEAPLLAQLATRHPALTHILCLDPFVNDEDADAASDLISKAVGEAVTTRTVHVSYYRGQAAYENIRTIFNVEDAIVVGLVMGLNFSRGLIGIESSFVPVLDSWIGLLHDVDERTCSLVGVDGVTSSWSIPYEIAYQGTDERFYNKSSTISQQNEELKQYRRLAAM